MFAINKLLFLTMRLDARIAMLGLAVWARETAYHTITRYSFRTGVVLRAAGDADDDVQARIDAAVEAAVAGLKANNAALKADLRKAKAGSEIDPAEVERLEARVEELNALVTKANKDVTTLTKRAETAEAAAAAETAAVSKLVVENGLMAALSAAGVTDPDFAAAAAASIRSGQKIELTTDGDTRVAVVGGKPLGDYVKEWSASDSGKKFVSAPNNGGGGAGGPGGKPAPTNPFKAETKNVTAQGALFKENPTLARQMAAEAGVPIPD